MNSPPQSPTKIRPGSRDTGFPEPFCGQRNTTLPHPDANLSPDAVISQDDIAINKVLSRTRRSFLAKHKRTISHGVITAQMEAMYSDMLPLEDVDSAGPIDLESPEVNQSSFSAGRPSKDGNYSLMSTTMGSSPTSSEAPRRRSSILRRFRWHK